MMSVLMYVCCSNRWRLEQWRVMTVSIEWMYMAAMIQQWWMEEDDEDIDMDAYRTWDGDEESALDCWWWWRIDVSILLLSHPFLSYWKRALEWWMDDGELDRMVEEQQWMGEDDASSIGAGLDSASMMMGWDRMVANDAVSRSTTSYYLCFLQTFPSHCNCSDRFSIHTFNAAMMTTCTLRSTFAATMHGNIPPINNVNHSSSLHPNASMVRSRP